MSLACKLWNLIIIRGLEQASPVNAIFLSIAKAKAHYRAILTHYLKNWMQKKKDKWPHNGLSWKKQAFSLMKWSKSRPDVSCTSMMIKIKWCPSWNTLYLWILAMALSSATALVGRLMTLIATVFYVRSITTTSTTKTWSSRNHVKIDLQWNSSCKGVLSFSPYNVPTLSNEGIHDVFDDIMCGYSLTFKWTTC
jgi:hypothetical protein